MSSPIASNKKSFFKKSLISVHKKLSHNHRIEILGKIISAQIVSLRATDNETKILDIGCGDMSLMETIQTYVDNVNPTCLDIYPLPEKFSDDLRWK